MNEYLTRYRHYNYIYLLTSCFFVSSAADRPDTSSALHQFHIGSIEFVDEIMNIAFMTLGYDSLTASDRRLPSPQDTPTITVNTDCAVTRSPRVPDSS